jgi:arylsulfatase A-like enzyme
VDTLRADHLGAYGDPRGNSPAMDRLLRQGTSFTNVIAPRGQTWPSLATVLTGQPPAVHGVRTNGLRLAVGARTVAEALAEEGYDCMAALANSGSAAWPGFARMWDHRTDDRRVTGTAIAAWRRAASPRFLWVHLFGPHRPYQPPAVLVRRLDPGYEGPVDGSIAQIRAVDEGRRVLSSADRAHLRARYAAAVRATDARVRDLMRTIEAGAGETLVVFTSDHGEELLDRNGYVSHSASVYDSVLRVPLGFRWPGRIPAGVCATDVMELGDVARTVLALLDCRGAAVFPGRDRRDALPAGAASAAGAASPEAAGTVEPAAPPQMAFSELEDRVVSLRTPDFRYVSNPGGFHFPLGDEGAAYPIRREELYDLRVDPGERVNVAERRTAETARLRQVAARWRAEVGWDAASRRFRTRGIPDDVTEPLEALGYTP